MATVFEPIKGNSLTLRALGGDPDGRIHYTVINRTKQVLLYLQVNPETELIHILNKTSPEEYLPTGVQYIATGGLKNSASEMVIERVTGEAVAKINDKGIQFGRAEDFPDQQLSFNYRYDSETKESLIEVKYTGTVTYGRFNEATIQGFKKGSSLNTIFRLAVTPLQRLVSVLASIKFYYCFFNYSSLPIPKQIPALMTSSKNPGILDILKSTNDFRIRASCESETGNRYIDLLDENTRLVLMVAETGVAARMQILFFDSFGDMKYYSEEYYDKSVGTKQVYVYDSDGKQIGSCDDQKYYDGQSQVVATMEVLGKRMRIYKSNERTRIAVAVDEDESSSVSISFCKELDVQLKVLIIANVLIYAYKVLQIFRITVPAFKKYPFREALL